MDFEKGYRLKFAGSAGFAATMSSWRAQALKMLADVYGARVAEACVFEMDACHLGLEGHEGDLFEKATVSVREDLAATIGGVFASKINCIVDFHFAGSATLALMIHGSETYGKAWETRREVFRWGWTDGAPPRGLTSEAWAERQKYWSAVDRARKSGMGSFRFELLTDSVPPIGWQKVEEQFPAFEKRVSTAVERLAEAEGIDAEKLSEGARTKLAERVRKTLIKDPSRHHMAPRASMRPKQEKEPKKIVVKKRPTYSDSSIIDHADIVVSADGRPFMAVPAVGLDKNERLFVQIGSKHVIFLQGGIQYGAVTDVAADARDYLRGLTSITVVEVEEKEGRRLLRAKHAAMVQDISLGEGFRRPIQSFSKRAKTMEIQET